MKVREAIFEAWSDMGGQPMILLSRRTVSEAFADVELKEISLADAIVRAEERDDEPGEAG